MPTLALLLVVAGALGCAGPPSKPIAPGSRVVVALYDASSGSRLALANASHPTFRDVYSQLRSDATLKLAPDQLMGELLASLDAASFPRWAQPAPTARPRDPLQPGAFGLAADLGFLALVEGDQVRVFVEPGRAASVEERQAFVNLKLVMDLYYTPVGELQYIENDVGAAIFKQPETRP